MIITDILGPTLNTLIIVLPIVIIIGLVLALIVIVITVLKRRDSGTYSPQQAERNLGVQLEDNKPKEESVAKQLPQAEHVDISQTS